MAAFNKFNCFVGDVGLQLHNLNTDTLKVMLTNTTPVATNTIKTNLTEISAGNGYTAGGVDTVSTATFTAADATAFWIGKHTVPTLAFTGRIDETYFWKRVLTAPERAALQTPTVSVPGTSLRFGYAITAVSGAFVETGTAVTLTVTPSIPVESPPTPAPAVIPVFTTSDDGELIISDNGHQKLLEKILLSQRRTIEALQNRR